ncbi:MAG: helix-turn-helix domain-containing protein [Nitrospirota bacterium]
MKRLSEQTHYEILDIDTDAAKTEIEAAYKLAKKTFGEDSLGTYSLFNPEEKNEILKRIEDAYRVLVNEKRREEYDSELEKKGWKIERIKEKPEYKDVKREEPSINLSEILKKLNNEFTGKNLRMIRKKMNISLQEIANITRVNITYLQFIEDDDYEELPYEVYLKGYLTQYLKYMGIESRDVIDGYVKFYRDYWNKGKK